MRHPFVAQTLFLLLGLVFLRKTVRAFSPPLTPAYHHNRDARLVRRGKQRQGPSLLLVRSSSKQGEEDSISPSDVLEQRQKVVASASEEESSESSSLSNEKEKQLAVLGVWLVSISSFILVNNFVQPWPQSLFDVPERVFFLFHMLGGMLFGGGIVLTTAMERLVASDDSLTVQRFWFQKVPTLDALIVLPALTTSMVSGTGLATVRYGGLNLAPPHVAAIFYALIAFLAWWGFTDVSTQQKAFEALMEKAEDDGNVPDVVRNRIFSNVGSCLFIVLLYFIMVMKPGTLTWYF